MLRKKLIVLIIISISLFSCNNKKENIKKLFIVEDNIDLALKSQDRAFIETVISDIGTMEEVYPEHQSLKEKKYILQIRLGKYENAIDTIDTLIKLSPDNIDDRIVQGILYEIIGYKSSSIEVWEKALDLIEEKIDKMLKKDEKKKLGRDVNRVMILKLLGRDTQNEYDRVKNDPTISNHPEILQILYLLEDGSREQLINRYRN